jgi:hypothetical protein
MFYKAVFRRICRIYFTCYGNSFRKGHNAVLV